MKEGASSARQGQAWDWKSPAHRALGPRLLEVLQRVHDLGIGHGDLHPGNILVTPDSVTHKAYLLDSPSDSQRQNWRAQQDAIQAYGNREDHSQGCCSMICATADSGPSPCLWLETSCHEAATGA